MARVRVWYEWNGKRGTVEHVGQTTFSGKRNNGKAFTDEDAPKKSVTDGLIKALSMIGFAGDIFLGRYDDSKYVADLKREIANEQDNGSPQSKPRPEDIQKFKDAINAKTKHEDVTVYMQSEGTQADLAALSEEGRQDVKDYAVEKMLALGWEPKRKVA
jgi:hypothetical protein